MANKPSNYCNGRYWGKEQDELVRIFVDPTSTQNQKTRAWKKLYDKLMYMAGSILQKYFLVSGENQYRYMREGIQHVMSAIKIQPDRINKSFGYISNALKFYYIDNVVSKKSYEKYIDKNYDINDAVWLSYNDVPEEETMNIVDREELKNKIIKEIHERIKGTDFKDNNKKRKIPKIILIKMLKCFEEYIDKYMVCSTIDIQSATDYLLAKGFKIYLVNRFFLNEFKIMSDTRKIDRIIDNKLENLEKKHKANNQNQYFPIIDDDIVPLKSNMQKYRSHMIYKLKKEGKYIPKNKTKKLIEEDVIPGSETDFY